jgi:hypothetical protein
LDVEPFRVESFIVHVLHRVQVIILSIISLFFPCGLHTLCRDVIEYWLQTQALSGFDLSGCIARLAAIVGPTIAGSISPRVDITWLAESNGLIFESRADRVGLD